MECGRVKHHSIEIVAHQELTEADLSELRQLFDSEYLKEFGEWDPQQPYGYASHDIHIMAQIEGCVVGHLGFGYLGCREQVVPFYESCGWTRILPREKSIGRAGEFIVDEPGPPILILPIASLEPWPEGDVDLRGRAWQSLTAVGPRCRKSVECRFALSPLEAHRQFFPDTLWSLE